MLGCLVPAGAVGLPGAGVVGVGVVGLVPGGTVVLLPGAGGCATPAGKIRRVTPFSTFIVTPTKEQRC